MPPNGTDALRTLSVVAARWQAILDTTQDAIICITSDGEISLFNAGAEQMFGYTAGEVVGRNVRMLMPAPYREEHSGYLRHYLETGTAKAIGRVRRVVAQRKDGSPFPIELSVSESRVGNEIFDYPSATAVPPFDTLPPDVILVTDFEMPGRTGVELADAFRRAHPRGRAILLSAYAVDGPVTARPWLRFVAKPVDYSTLHRRIHAL